MNTIEELIELGKTGEGKDRLRVLLATALGFKRYRIDASEVQLVGPDEHWLTTKKWKERGIRETDEEPNYISDTVPDWTRDLNACHEVEKDLTDVQYGLFIFHVLKMVPERDMERREFFSASATQRTIALILTLQKS